MAQAQRESRNTARTARSAAAIEMELQSLSSNLYAPDSWINCLLLPPLSFMHAQLESNLYRAEEGH